jgi:predicted anti-sigma-YlaC factor YlaD
VGQLALSSAVLVGAAEAGHGELAGASPVHLAHEGAAWNVALGVGFLWAASVRADRLSGLVPLLAAFVAVLAGLSAFDLVAGHVLAERLVTHLLAVAGLVLILIRRRTAPDDGRSGRRGGRGRSGVAPIDGRRAGDPPRSTGSGGLRPTARRHAA